MGYYAQRQGLEYYQAVRDIVAQLRQGVTPVETALDVGCMDCPIVTELGIPDCTAMDRHRPRQFDGCAWITGDLLTYQFPRASYHLVLCLECLEHITDVDRAVARLQALAANYLLVSLPYKWTPDMEPSHVHNHIDEAWIARHIGPPDHYRICGRGRARHIVALYIHHTDAGEDARQWHTQS